MSIKRWGHFAWGKRLHPDRAWGIVRTYYNGNHVVINLGRYWISWSEVKH